MSLKAAIERELGAPVRVRAGALGSLRVLVDGRQIFSKHEGGRSPEPSELIRAIRQQTSNPAT